MRAVICFALTAGERPKSFIGYFQVLFTNALTTLNFSVQMNYPVSLVLLKISVESKL